MAADPETGGSPWRQRSFCILPLDAKLMQHHLPWSWLHLQAPSKKQQHYFQPLLIASRICGYNHAVTVSYTVTPCVHRVHPSSLLRAYSSHCTHREARPVGAVPSKVPVPRPRPPQKSPDSHDRAVLSFTPHMHIS